MFVNKAAYNEHCIRHKSTAYFISDYREKALRTDGRTQSLTHVMAYDLKWHSSIRWSRSFTTLVYLLLLFEEHVQRKITSRLGHIHIFFGSVALSKSGLSLKRRTTRVRAWRKKVTNGEPETIKPRINGRMKDRGRGNLSRGHRDFHFSFPSSGL